MNEAAPQTHQNPSPVVPEVVKEVAAPQTSWANVVSGFSGKGAFLSYVLPENRG